MPPSSSSRNSSSSGTRTVTATTSSGRTITMNVSAGIASAAGVSGSNVSQAGIRSSGGGGGGSTPSTPTPSNIVNISPGIAEAIRRNPSAFPSNYSYNVVDVASGKSLGQTISATGQASKGLGTFSGVVQDISKLTAQQIASGQANKTQFIQDNKLLAEIKGIGTPTGMVQDITGLTAEQIAQGQALSTTYLYGEKLKEDKTAGSGTYYGEEGKIYQLDLATGVSTIVSPTGISVYETPKVGDSAKLLPKGIIPPEVSISKKDVGTPILTEEEKQANLLKIKTYQPYSGTVLYDSKGQPIRLKEVEITLKRDELGMANAIKDILGTSYNVLKTGTTWTLQKDNFQKITGYDIDLAVSRAKDFLGAIGEIDRKLKGPEIRGVLNEGFKVGVDFIGDIAIDKLSKDMANVINVGIFFNNLKTQDQVKVSSSYSGTVMYKNGMPIRFKDTIFYGEKPVKLGYVTAEQLKPYIRQGLANAIRTGSSLGASVIGIIGTFAGPETLGLSIPGSIAVAGALKGFGGYIGDIIGTDNKIKNDKEQLDKFIKDFATGSLQGLPLQAFSLSQTAGTGSKILASAINIFGIVEKVSTPAFEMGLTQKPAQWLREYEDKKIQEVNDTKNYISKAIKSTQGAVAGATQQILFPETELQAYQNLALSSFLGVGGQAIRPLQKAFELGIAPVMGYTGLKQAEKPSEYLLSSLGFLPASVRVFEGVKSKYTSVRMEDLLPGIPKGDVKGVRVTVDLKFKINDVERHLVYDKKTGPMETPGGGLPSNIEKGDLTLGDVLRTAQKEVLEETGIKLKIEDLELVNILNTSNETQFLVRIKRNLTEKNIPTLLTKAAKKEGITQYRFIDEITSYQKGMQQFPYASPVYEGFGAGISKFFEAPGTGWLRQQDILAMKRFKALEEYDKLSIEQKQKMSIEGEKYFREKLSNQGYSKQRVEQLIRQMKESPFGVDFAKEMFLDKRGLTPKKLVSEAPEFKVDYNDPLDMESFIRENKKFIAERVQPPSIRSFESILDYVMGRKTGQFRKGTGKSYEEVKLGLKESYTGKGLSVNEMVNKLKELKWIKEVNTIEKFVSDGRTIFNNDGTYSIIINGSLSKKEQQIALSHELIHVLQGINLPFIFKFNKFIPYELRPSELMAFGLEEKRLEKGYKQSKYKFSDIGMIDRLIYEETGEKFFQKNFGKEYLDNLRSKNIDLGERYFLLTKGFGTKLELNRLRLASETQISPIDASKLEIIKYSDRESAVVRDEFGRFQKNIAESRVNKELSLLFNPTSRYRGTPSEVRKFINDKYFPGTSLSPERFKTVGELIEMGVAEKLGIDLSKADPNDIIVLSRDQKKILTGRTTRGEDVLFFTPPTSASITGETIASLSYAGIGGMIDYSGKKVLGGIKPTALLVESNINKNLKRATLGFTEKGSPLKGRNVKEIELGIAPGSILTPQDVSADFRFGQQVLRVQEARLKPEEVLQKTINENLKEMQKQIENELKGKVEERAKKVEKPQVKEKLTTKELSADQKSIILRQAEHEFNLLEISLGKVTEKQKEIWIKERYKRLLNEYSKEVSPIKQEVSNSEIVKKQIKEERAFESEIMPKRPLKSSIAEELGKFARQVSAESETMAKSTQEYGIPIKSLYYPEKYATYETGKMYSYAPIMEYPTLKKEYGYPTKYKELYKTKPYKESYGNRIDYEMKEIEKKMFKALPSLPKKKESEKPIKYQMGYYAVGKSVKTGKFLKINNLPVTKERAKDIGSYYVRQTLARTFRIEKANRPAQPDYEFMYIPEGYFSQVSGKLREYKIKKKEKIGTPEQFIEKAMFSLDTQAEKEQLAYFRNLQKSINRNI